MSLIKPYLQPNFTDYINGSNFASAAAGILPETRLRTDVLQNVFAEFAKLPLIKPYLDPNFTDYTNGANFASSGAGVLPQTSSGTLYLALQVSFFEDAVERLKRQKGDKKARELMSEAVYHFGMGGNDYMTFVNNSMYSNATLTPHEREVFVGWVIGNLTTSIKKVYQLGGRKFSFQNCGPIGCMPTTRFEMRIDGCWNDTELLAYMHNRALAIVLEDLERELPGFKYVLFDYHGTLLDRIINSSKYGFEYGKSACCGSGAYNGNFTCGVKGDYFTLCPTPTSLCSSIRPTRQNMRTNNYRI